MTRTIWIVVTPRGTQAIRSLLGTLSNSSCTRKPSAKPSTQPRQVASRWMRAASLFPSLSMPPSLFTLEETSRKSLPDLLISGCSGVLFGPVLVGEQIKKIASRAGTRSRRTAPSHRLRDSTSDLGWSTNTLARACVLLRQLECGGSLSLRPLRLPSSCVYRLVRHKMLIQGLGCGFRNEATITASIQMPLDLTFHARRELPFQVPANQMHGVPTVHSCPTSSGPAWAGPFSSQQGAIRPGEKLFKFEHGGFSLPPTPDSHH